MQTFSEKVEIEVRQLAEKAVGAQHSNAKKLGFDESGSERGASSSKSSLSADKNLEGEDEINQGKGGKKKKGTASSAKEKTKEEIDEETGGRGAKGKRKTGRTKGGIGSLIGGAGNDSTKAVKRSPTTEDVDMPTQDQLVEKILEWFPDMGFAGLGKSVRYSWHHNQ